MPARTARSKAASRPTSSGYRPESTCARVFAQIHFLLQRHERSILLQSRRWQSGLDALQEAEQPVHTKNDLQRLKLLRRSELRANLEVQLSIELKIIDGTNAECLAQVGNPSICPLLAGGGNFLRYDGRVRNIGQCISNEEGVLSDRFDLAVVQVRCVPLLSTEFRWTGSIF